MFVAIFFVGYFFARPAYAQSEYTYSAVVNQQTLQNVGALLSWQDIELGVPAGAYSQEVHFRIRNRGSISELEKLPELPKKFRSKKIVYAYYASAETDQDLTVRLHFNGTKNKKRRIFYLAPGAGSWVRLRTIQNRNEGYAQARVPSSGGKLVLALHRSKKEEPIKKIDFLSFGTLPQSDTAAIIDAKSGKFLLKRKARKQRSIASISKIVTTMVFMETNPDMDSLITYSTYNDRMGATVSLNDGDQLTAKQALMSVLIPSANNMAQTLAVSTSMSEATFIQQMNNRMIELGLNKTNFVEPTGLNSDNVSSAGNLARLGRYIFRQYDDLFYEAAHTNPYTYYLANSGEGITLYSTNKFDGAGKYEVTAFKTGYYPGTADRTLLTKIKQISTGHEIIVVLLGNPYYNTIFQEAYGLAEWAFNNWEFHNY